MFAYDIVLRNGLASAFVLRGKGIYWKNVHAEENDKGNKQWTLQILVFRGIPCDR